MEILAIAGMLALCGLVKYNLWKAKLACDALHDDCDAADALVAWRVDNPNGCFSCSSEGRKLLARNIATYARFLTTHPFITDNGHLDFLHSLGTCTCEPPPKRRRGIPCITPRPRTEADLFTSSY